EASAAAPSRGLDLAGPHVGETRGRRRRREQTAVGRIDLEQHLQTAHARPVSTECLTDTRSVEQLDRPRQAIAAPPQRADLDPERVEPLNGSAEPAAAHAELPAPPRAPMHLAV